MKKVILVAPYFTPSNLAGVHRLRLLASGLREVGWEPVVITVREQDYEERNDTDAIALLPRGLRIERVPAWPARLCRRIGLGDISIRAQWSIRARIARILKTETINVVFCTILPGYSSLIGAWVKQRFGIPFILDYQDPWYQSSAEAGFYFSKSAIAKWLAAAIEPRVLPLVDALTAVSSETLGSLRSRNLIKPLTPIQIVPIGADPRDHEIASISGRSLISSPASSDGLRRARLMYFGTLTSKMLPVLKAVLQAVKMLNAHFLARNASTRCVFIEVYLIGTSASSDGEDSLGVANVIGATGTGDCVHLEPKRIPYLDALRTMQDADILLMIGSTDSHYTASKIFPYWLAARPILGVFHAASNIVMLGKSLGGVSLVTYDTKKAPADCTKEITEAISRILVCPEVVMGSRKQNAFEPYSAHGIAATYAGIFSRCLGSSVDGNTIVARNTPQC